MQGISTSVPHSASSDSIPSPGLSSQTTASYVQPPQVPIGVRFGSRIRSLRKQRRMTQLQMAIRFGIDRSFISGVERGERNLSIETMEILALGFKIDLSDLLRDL